MIKYNFSQSNTTKKCILQFSIELSNMVFVSWQNVYIYMLWHLNANKSFLNAVFPSVHESHHYSHVQRNLYYSSVMKTTIQKQLSEMQNHLVSYIDDSQIHIMPLVTPMWRKLCFVSHVYSCFRLCMYWEILLQGRQLSGFITLSGQSTEVFIIQGGAAQSLVMAVHANYLYATASSTAYWIT